MNKKNVSIDVQRTTLVLTVRSVRMDGVKHAQTTQTAVKINVVRARFAWMDVQRITLALTVKSVTTESAKAALTTLPVARVTFVNKMPAKRVAEMIKDVHRARFANKIHAPSRLVVIRGPALLEKYVHKDGVETAQTTLPVEKAFCAIRVLARKAVKTRKDAQTTKNVTPKNKSV
ncbi:MAG: hypothetical protein AAGJ35_05250 [Myxococcota bacterium]